MDGHVPPTRLLPRLGLLLTLPILLLLACAVETAPVGSATSPAHLTITVRAESVYLPYSALTDNDAPFSVVAKC